MTDGLRGPRNQVRSWLRDRRDGSAQAGGLNLLKRVRDLEEEMQEMRRLNRRLAELMDIVEELLVPLSQQDQERVRAYLDSHSTLS